MGNFGIFCGKCGIILGFFNLVPFMNSVYNYKSEFNSSQLASPMQLIWPKLSGLEKGSQGGQPIWVVNKGLT